MRTFPKRIAEAIKAQYRTCQYPGGCDIPIAYTDLHHDGIPWWDGGPTNPDNGKPYCHAHNIQAEIDRLHPTTPQTSDNTGNTRDNAGNPRKTGEPGGSLRYRQDHTTGAMATTHLETDESGGQARFRDDQPVGGPETANPETGIPGKPGGLARSWHDPHRRDWTTHHPDAA